MKELDYRQAVTILQESGFTDLVGATIQLADQIALKGAKPSGEVPDQIYECLTEFFISMANVLQDSSKS